MALPNWKGSSRAVSNDWPLFSLYRVAVASTLLKTLANLTQCGMKLSDALVQAEIRNTPFAKAHIQTMRETSDWSNQPRRHSRYGSLTAKRTQRDEGPWHSRQLHRTAQRKRATPQ
ncbi:hypothetical protein QYZ42_24920 [Vibrio parahaemolyticus]|nr:hypothetical protein [Vibrio parahaemolyticus]